MLHVGNHGRIISGLLIGALAQPLVVPVWGAQAQPTTQLVEVIQYYDKAKVDWEAKNLVAAKQTCRDGISRLNRVPDNDESRRMRGQLEPMCKDVDKADERLKSQSDKVKDLTSGGRLDGAQKLLEGIREFAEDPRYKEADSRLQLRNTEYENTVREARSHASAGRKKDAHNAFKKAQDLNKDVSLRSDINATNGCFAGCKALVWTVVLAGGGAASYYGYKEYEKQKNK